MSISKRADTVLDPAGGPTLKPKEFEEISRFARQRFGLDLKSGKEELVAARLAKRVRQGGYRSYGDYFQAAIADPNSASLAALIDALTTNHTSFLREPSHFDFLKNVVYASHRTGSPMRIWSAACSTGEEPYTIVALTAAEAPSVLPYLRVLATDISTKVLDAAQKGAYPESSLRDLPANWVNGCFVRGKAESAGRVRIRAELAKLIEFRRINLIEEFRGSERFEVIFCRNVMIYFDKPTQELVVRRVAERLVPGGYLFVGHSESLAGVTHSLTYVKPAIYRNSRP